MLIEDDTPAPKPETYYPTARLAALTGLPAPETIVDPDRLEGLTHAIRHKLSHLSPNTPLKSAGRLRRLHEARGLVPREPGAVRRRSLAVSPR